MSSYARLPSRGFVTGHVDSPRLPRRSAGPRGTGHGDWPQCLSGDRSLARPHRHARPRPCRNRTGLSSEYQAERIAHRIYEHAEAGLSLGGASTPKELHAMGVHDDNANDRWRQQKQLTPGASGPPVRVLVADSQSLRQLHRRVRLARRDNDRGSPSQDEAKRRDLTSPSPRHSRQTFALLRCI
jgi:hypothetical protein